MNKYTNNFLNNVKHNDNNKYKLKDNIYHDGSTDEGHYYSIIKDNLYSKWHKFNDS